MNVRYCVKMPYLRHKPLEGQDESAFCRHFWPGLPFSGIKDFERKYWLSPDLPFDEKFALAIFRTMRSLDSGEISRMLHVEHSYQIGDEIKFQTEMADLDAFVTPRTLRPYSFPAEHAQKILLWRWFEESLWEDLASLSTQCATQSDRLASIFGTAAIWNLAADNFHGSSWRTVLVNALFFLPPDIPVLCEGPMAEDLSEKLEFHEDARLGATLGLSAKNYSLAMAEAPGTQALELRGYDLPDFLTKKRLWLIWSEKS